MDSGNSGDRERLITAALLELEAVDASGGYAIDAIHALTRWTIRILDVSGVGVMMTDDRGALRSMVVTSESVRRLEAAELDRGKGPCVESHRSGCAVVHADIDVPDARWPDFAPIARAGGVRSVHAIPLQAGDTAIGVLNLFRAAPGGLADPEAAVAQALADAVGGNVHRRQSAIPSGLRTEELITALADAAIVERATGTLAVRLRVDVDTAHAILRRKADERGCATEDLATAVVDGTTSVELPLTVEAPVANDSGSATHGSPGRLPRQRGTAEGR